MNKTTRGLLFLIPALAFATTVQAASPPDLLNYQGVLRDASDNPLEGDYDMSFRFFDANIAGNEILVDHHLAADTGAVKVKGGLFNVALGSGEVIDGPGPGTYATLAEVFRDHSAVWLEVQVQAEVLSPRIQVVSAGYALNAAHLDGRGASEFIDTSATTQTKAGNLNVGGNAKVTGQLTISGGNPELGRVLTSDATGLAEWSEGVPGPQGPAGPTGPTGPAGPPGVTGRPVYADTEVEALWDPLYTAATIGSDGLPIMVYHLAPDDIRVVHCLDAACTTSEGNFPLGTGAGLSPSITIGTDGLPLIAYMGTTSIMVAHCLDVACSSATTTPVSTHGVVDISITIGTDGFPIIAVGTAIGLNVVHCNDSRCEDPVDETNVSGRNNAGNYTSISIGSDGLPFVAYSGDDPTLGPSLWLARCGDLACTTSTEGRIDDGGEYVSMAIGTDLYPVFSYRSGLGLRIAHCRNEVCQGGIDIWISIGQLGGFSHTSLAIGADGLPIVSYFDEANEDLRIARCADTACTNVHTWRHHADSSGVHGRHNSITVGTDGFPVISYANERDHSLHVIHCSNRACLPYHRAR